MTWLAAWFATRDVARQRAARAIFLELFNSSEAVAANEDGLRVVTPLIYPLIQAELAQPESAQFDKPYVRECRDGILRAAGRVRFAGSNENLSTGWFLVEFDADLRPTLLDILDVDPVSRKDLPPPNSWSGGVIPYGGLHTPPRDRSAIIWRTIWAIVILGGACFVAVVWFG